MLAAWQKKWDAFVAEQLERIGMGQYNKRQDEKVLCQRQGTFCISGKQCYDM